MLSARFIAETYVASKRPQLNRSRALPFPARLTARFFPPTKKAAGIADQEADRKTFADLIYLETMDPIYTPPPSYEVTQAVIAGLRFALAKRERKHG